MTRVGTGGTRRGRPGSRWDRWLASWRLALRLGRREVRRNRGRSALIAALVGAPVLLITAFLTFFSSQDISLEEGIDRELGRSAAAVWPTTTGGHGFVAGVGTTEEGAATEVVDGWSASDPWDDARVAATVGSPVHRIGHTDAVPAGGATATGTDWLRVLVLDEPPAGVTEPLGSLREGRWPQGEAELVVTPAGVSRGLPTSGDLELVLGDEAEHPRFFVVVGVADAAMSGSTNADIVLPSAAAPATTNWQWLLDREEPVALADAQHWAAHGLDVASREIQLNPLPEHNYRAQNQTREGLYYAMIGLAILVETVLLAGPAFAVSAARQRHSLALAGAQGAARADIRRTVIAHGLVLAVLAAAGAALLGAALGLGGAGVLAGLRPGQHVQLELPWLWVSLLVVASVLASGAAAWWPARGATRLDIMSVLRGQVVSAHVGRGWPLAGMALALAGAGLLGWSLTVEPHRATPWMVVGAVLLGLGVMTLVPALLAVLARLSGGAPLPWRLAARDAVRQRSRAVPAVLAIVAAVGVMVGVATVVSSVIANQERQYTAWAPDGTMEVWTPTTEQADRVEAAVARALPGATAYPLTEIPRGPGWDDVTMEPTDRPFQTTVPGECTPQDVTTVTGPTEPPLCLIDGGRAFVVAPMAALERTGALTPEMKEVLEAGGLIEVEDRRVGPEPSPAEVLTVTAPGRMTGVEGKVELTGPVQAVRLPVVRVTPKQMDGLRMGGMANVSGYLTAQTAEQLGWEGQERSFLVAGDDAFTTEQSETLVEELADAEVRVYLERGFVQDPSSRVLILAIVGVFALVALAAVVISTALAISEGQRDSATMAAVGASAWTRRQHAALHAVLVGSVGVGLGLLLGLVVGGVLAWVDTSTTFYGGHGVQEDLGGVVDVPWVELGLGVVAVPLIAAAVAWLSVRSEPVLTRVVT